MIAVGTICILTGDFDETKYPIPPKRVERSETECVHTPQPPDYLAWHEWAERASKTHSQIRCPCCGRWAIWLPKKEALPIRRRDNREANRFADAYMRWVDEQRKARAPARRKRSRHKNASPD